jgi:hypothetical protein
VASTFSEKFNDSGLAIAGSGIGGNTASQGAEAVAARAARWRSGVKII